jgi:polysaccharide export outer membrane protein
MKLFWRLSAMGSVISCGVLLAGLLFSGCAAPEDPIFSSGPAEIGAPTGTPRVGVASDAFGLGDQVIVTFSDASLQPHEERIKDDGTITLHLIGPVKAVGKTPGELQKDIQELYVPKYYQPGRLTVTVKSQERAYYVGGEVRNPNRYIYSGAITVTKAIQTAGDFTDFANKKKVRLTRADGKTITVNCKKIQAGSIPDPPVFPGDKIHVPRRLL